MIISCPKGALAALAVATMILVSCTAPPTDESPLISVTVRGVTGASDRSLAPGELRAFETYWTMKRRAVLPTGQVLDGPVRLDVRRQHGGASWIYYPSGYTRIFSVGATTVYQVPDSDSFNRLLGLSR